MTAPAIAISTRRTGEDWRRIIAADLGRTVESIVAAGRHLNEAKNELPHGEFGPLLESLKLNERTAQRLMKIAANEVLANPTHGSHLPPSWRTLYELATLPPELLEAKIVDGTITPEIERKDVAALKAPPASRLAVDDPDPPAPKPTTAELVRENEALRAHNEDLESGREVESEVSPSIAEAKRRLEIENNALRSEIEELKAERDRLRERVAELEAALAASGAVQVEKPKRGRGRPKGSKNKPKPPADHAAVGGTDMPDIPGIPDSLRRAS